MAHVSFAFCSPADDVTVTNGLIDTTKDPGGRGGELAEHSPNHCWLHENDTWYSLQALRQITLQK